MICDGPVYGTRWVCAECAQRWELTGSVTSWPEWARLLRRLEKSRRIGDAHDVGMLSLDGDGDPVECAEEPPDALMAYAPYEDEDANAEYRRACGMGERDGREGNLRGDAAADLVSGESVG
jgi:hypothetical protein